MTKNSITEDAQKSSHECSHKGCSGEKFLKLLKECKMILNEVLIVGGEMEDSAPNADYIWLLRVRLLRDKIVNETSEIMP